MGIYIKNMEMPESCLDCRFIDYYKRQFYCHVINDIVTGESNERLDKVRCQRCPFVEINDEKIVKVATLKDVRDAVNWAVGEIKSGMDWVETNDLKGYPLKEIIAMAESGES